MTLQFALHIYNSKSSIWSFTSRLSFSDLVAHGPGRVDEAPVGGAGDAVICPPLIPVPLHLGQTHQQRRQGGQHHCGQRHRVCKDKWLNSQSLDSQYLVTWTWEYFVKSVRSLSFSWRSECFPPAMDHRRCGAGGLAPAFSLQTGIWGLGPGHTAPCLAPECRCLFSTSGLIQKWQIAKFD